MSEQYQRFKQNFFRQHPPASSGSQSYQENATRHYKQYDPYNEFTSGDNQSPRNGGDQHLRIDNQTHFPFDEIQQNTFQQLDNDPFFSYKQQQNYQATQKPSNQNPSGKGRNQFYDSEYRNYGTSQQRQERAIAEKTQSHFQFKNLPQPEFSKQSSYRNDNLGIDRINKQLDSIRLNRQEHLNQIQRDKFANSNFYADKPQTSSSNLGPQNYQIHRQYVVQDRSKSQVPTSPPKQLPVIYNRPNSLSNSQHKVNPQSVSPANSRLIIQQQGPSPSQVPIVLSPHQNPIQPLVMNSLQVPTQFPNNAGSGSRVIIQSQMVGQNKQVIPSNTLKPPPMYSPQQAHSIVMNQPPIRIQAHQNNQAEGMVPLREYQRLKGECGMWQQKFYQANDQLTRLQSQRGDFFNQGFSQDVLVLREQNARLMQKIRILQSSQKSSYEKFEKSYEELIKKYQSSLSKQCNLLIDRFRLELKHNQRY